MSSFPLGYSRQGSFTPAVPPKILNRAPNSNQENRGVIDSGQKLSKDQSTPNKDTSTAAPIIPQFNSATNSTSRGLTYSYGQTRSNYLSGVGSGQKSYSFGKKSPTDKQIQLFLPLKGKIQSLSRESMATFTDLDAEINDLASIVRREREQTSISRRSSSLVTITAKSTTNVQSPGHRELSQPAANINHSLRQSISENMEESENSIVTKTSSLQARYVGSQIPEISLTGQHIDPQHLLRQVSLLRNEVDELMLKQNDSNELAKRVREENDVLCVKLLAAEKTIATNKSQIDGLEAQLFQARNAIYGSSQLLQNVAVLEDRLKVDSNQNIELSQALLRQESKYAACEAALNEERMRCQRKEAEFQQLVAVLESLKNDYDRMKIENAKMKEDNCKEKADKSMEMNYLVQEANAEKSKRISMEEETKMLKVELGRVFTESEQIKNELSKWQVSCDGLNKDINSYKQGIQSLQSENGLIKQENSRLNDQIRVEREAFMRQLSQVKNENEILQSENDQIKKQIIASQDADIHGYADQVSKLNAHVAALNTSKDNSQRRIDELQMQNQLLIGQINSLKSQQMNMAQEISFMKSENAKIYDELRITKADSDNLRKKYAEDLEEAQKQLNQQDEKSKKLRSQCLILSQNATALSDKVLSLREKNKSLETKILANASMPQEEGERISSLLNEIQFLQTKLEESKVNEGNMKETIEKINTYNNSSSLEANHSNYSDTKLSSHQISDLYTALTLTKPTTMYSQ